MVVGVVAHQMAGRRDRPGPLRLGLDPATLNEERGPDRPTGEDVQEALERRRLGRPVGMLRVEGQGDPGAGYFSTPVMTIPRTNARWKTMNRMTGTTRVIMLPAWMKAGFW